MIGWSALALVLALQRSLLVEQDFALGQATFTAGIGEHSADVRARICSRLAFLGVALDEEKNREERTDDRRISRGPVDVWVIPTNEELEIARMTFAELTR